MGRAAKADEISPCFVFLATEDSAFVTGQVIHANGSISVSLFKRIKVV